MATAVTTESPGASAENRPTGIMRLQLLIAALLVVLVLLPATAVLGQTATTSDIADELDRTGRYLERLADAELESSIAAANGENIAFAWIDANVEAQPLAEQLERILFERNSRYAVVLVLTRSGVWAQASSNQRDPTAAANAAIEDFSQNEVATGLDVFTTVQSGGSSDVTATTTPVDGSSSNDSSSGLSSWLWLVVAAVAGFFGIRYIAGKRKTKQAEADLLELDRAEVREQLRDNADRVIELGDKVIASGDKEMINNYEQASQTYQEVSGEVDGVGSIEEMDKLDDRLDHAEWQFEVIEAKLQGRTPPTAPAPEVSDIRPGPATTTDAQPPPPRPRSRGDEPALGRDESVFDQRRPSSRPRYRSRRRRSGGMGGGLGGMMGGGLGSILGSIILGDGIGRPRTSRRTRQRRASTGSYGGRGGFDIGGGVFGQRGGGSSRSGSTRSRGGGGSLGGGRSSSRGGGGRF